MKNGKNVRGKKCGKQKKILYKKYYLLGIYRIINNINFALIIKKSINYHFKITCLLNYYIKINT